MLKKDAFYNEKFPATSKAMNYFKNTERGKKKVCKSVEKYAKEQANDLVKQTRINMIADFLSNGGSKSEARTKLKATPKEIKEA